MIKLYEIDVTMFYTFVELKKMKARWKSKITLLTTTIKKREYTVQNGTTDLGNKTQHR